MVEGKPSRGMTDERAKKLEGIGFKWSKSKIAWDKRLEQLAEYKARHGHINVPYNGSGLGHFVSKQRRIYKLWREGKPAPGMTCERTKDLDALGFRW